MTAPKQGTVHILVYGNDYHNQSLDDLSYTVDDAVQVGLALSKLCEKDGRAYHTTYIYGEDVSYDSRISSLSHSDMSHDLSWNNLENELINLAEAVKPEDITFIFYSGHGGEKSAKVAYGTDTSLTGSFAARATETSTEHVPVPVSKIIDRIEAIPGTKIILSDFCFSGSFVQAGYVSVTGTEYKDYGAIELFGDRSKIKESSSSFYLSASRYYEESHEGYYAPHGHFTQALLYALGWDEKTGTIKKTGAYKNGRITFFDVANYTMKNDKDSSQTPMYNGGSNDIVLFSF